MMQHTNHAIMGYHWDVCRKWNSATQEGQNQESYLNTFRIHDIQTQVKIYIDIDTGQTLRLY